MRTPPPIYPAFKPCAPTNQDLVDRKRPKNGILVGGRAAQMLGWDGFENETEVVWLVPHTTGTSRSGVETFDRYGRVIRSRAWTEEHDFLGGVPVAPPHLVLATIGEGLTSAHRWPGDYTPIPPRDRIELALEHYLRRGHPVPKLNTATLSIVRQLMRNRGQNEPPTESYAETRGIQQLRGQGLVKVFRQVPLCLQGKIVNRIDLVYPFRPSARRPDIFDPEEGAPVEIDGREYHERQFEKDRRRGNNHTVAGARLLVATPTLIERNTTELVRDINFIKDRRKQSGR